MVAAGDAHDGRLPGSSRAAASAAEWATGPARRPRRAAAAAGTRRSAAAASSSCSARKASSAGSSAANSKRPARSPRAARRRSPGRSRRRRPRRPARRRRAPDSRPCSIRAARAGARAGAAPAIVADVGGHARRPSAPPLSPWPRWSNATAAKPWRAQAARVVVVRLLARAGAVQDHDAAERLALRQESAYARPSRSPISAGGSTLTVRTAWHDPPPMAAAQQLSHVYPLGSRVNEHGRLRGRRLRHGRAGARVRDAVLRRRRGRHPRPRARLHAGVRGAHATTSRSSSRRRRSRARRSTGCSGRRGSAATSPAAGELALALAAGVDPERIHMHGNAKSAAELRYALESGVGEVIVDNQRDLDLLEELVPALRGGRPQPVVLRIAPGVSPDTHPAISTGGPNTKFGFDLAHAAGGDRARAARAPRSSCAACTCTSARRSWSSSRSARAARADGARRVRQLQPRRRARRRLRRARRAAVDRGLRRGEGRRRERDRRARASGSSTSRAARSSPTRA